MNTLDDYLAQCEASGKAANKPLSGLFNVRVGEQLHRQAVLYAHREGMNLNKVVITALEVLLLKSERRHMGHQEMFVMSDERPFHRVTSASTTKVVDQLKSEMQVPGHWHLGTETAILMTPYFEVQKTEGANLG